MEAVQDGRSFWCSLLQPFGILPLCSLSSLSGIIDQALLSPPPTSLPVSSVSGAAASLARPACGGGASCAAPVWWLRSRGLGEPAARWLLWL